LRDQRYAKKNLFSYIVQFLKEKQEDEEEEETKSIVTIGLVVIQRTLTRSSARTESVGIS